MNNSASRRGSSKYNRSGQDARALMCVPRNQVATRQGGRSMNGEKRGYKPGEDEERWSVNIHGGGEKE
jgi:hypothetical protein